MRGVGNTMLPSSPVRPVWVNAAKLLYFYDSDIACIVLHCQLLFLIPKRTGTEYRARHGNATSTGLRPLGEIMGSTSKAPARVQKGGASPEGRRRKDEWRGVLQGPVRREGMTTRERAAAYDKQIRPLPPHVVAERFATIEKKLSAMIKQRKSFDARFKAPVRDDATQEDAVRVLPEDEFQPILLELDPWAEHRRMTGCVQLLGARMRFHESSMDELAAMLGEVRYALGEALRVEDANISYRDQVYDGIYQLQRQTFASKATK